MQKLSILSLVVILTACDTEDYVLNKTGFCEGLDLAAGTSVICKDKNGYLITGNIVSNRSNGKMVFIVKNGKAHGVLKKYDEQGHLKLELNFKDGKPDGLAKHFYKNGKIETEDYFKEGVSNGIKKEYYENGQLKTEGNIINGKREGLVKGYYETGELYLEGHFINGVLEGENKTYYKNGQIRTIESFKNGEKNGAAYGYTNFGTLSLEKEYKNGKQIKQKRTSIKDLQTVCKKHFNVCSTNNWGVGCRESVSGDITVTNRKGVFVNNKVFVYTKKKYVSGDRIDNAHYYEYVDTVDFKVPGWGVQKRVRAYKETNIDAVCDFDILRLYPDL